MSVIDPVDSLRDSPNDGWAASPIDRMVEMLRTKNSTISIGVVTDGRWWAVVSAPTDSMAASGTVDALTWMEEVATRNAFVELLSIKRLTGGDPARRLPNLFKDSVLAAEQVTEALGVQVRQAVELLVAAFSEAAEDAKARQLPDPLPPDTDEIYEAVVTVMMRIVFLLFAEERNLLPQGVLFEQGYGMANLLDELEQREREEGSEALDSTYFAWHRLLATSLALFHGATFEDLRLPEYGGSLFDSQRFRFLLATNPEPHATLRLTVSDRVMMEALHAVQYAAPKNGEARRISFRDIDVEQIGYIYEGLLGFTCRRVDRIVLGLVGSAGNEPEMALDDLNALAEAQPADDMVLSTAIIDWLKTHQPSAKPPTAKQLAKLLAAGDTVEGAELALRAVSRDEEIRRDLRSWIGIIRKDLRGRPVVVLPGGLLVEETPSRKDAGAHYTPKSLAEEVVRYALEPLAFSPGPHQSDDRTRWVPISSDQILELRVADIACGSGAFLVAAARYLAAKLVEAWHREGSSYDNPRENELRALREVVAHCLYGADINAMAVEMCKLSLWLVSLDPALPFSFVDDKVLHGNSLLGLTSLDQLRKLHIYPNDAPDMSPLSGSLDVDGIINRVIGRRRQLSSVVEPEGPRSARAKQHLIDANNQDLAVLKKLADGVIAAGLPLGGPRGKDKKTKDVVVHEDGSTSYRTEHVPDRKLQAAYRHLSDLALREFGTAGQLPIDSSSGATGTGADSLDTLIDHDLTPTVTTDYDHWKPLHWILAVPDVMERGGFDAVIGNPPFLGGQKLTGAMGTNMRDWFVNVIARGARGSADYVAYFLIRAFDLLRQTGTVGLIATNTVAQGDTREVGLDQMVDHGFTITRSIQSRSWPSASANLEYAAVWGTRATVGEEVQPVSDDVPVRKISTLLEPMGRVEGNPQRLAENTGIAYIGCYVLGMGFVLEPEEAQEWIAADPRNAEVLFPYLNGEDLNSRPDASASRWVIDFGTRTRDEAATYRLPFDRVERLVKPERAKGKITYRRDNWWKFAAWAPQMRQAISDLSEVLVLAQTSKTRIPLFVPTAQVFDQKLVVFATSQYSDMTVLTSSFHQLWSFRYGSTMRADPVYTPSDIFETFPRPEKTKDLERIGLTLHSKRREIMTRRRLGLTKLYNLINDPNIVDESDLDVAQLRDDQASLDKAVMAAYGWDDIQLNHGFYSYRQMERWTICPTVRTEILDRLLEENRRRQ
ncbi:MAG: N-6 DNA methylase [Propionibacteriaceae bacterium]|nr:N-6 DNA methylase [Propionibacteriaceae bacterium]